MEEPLIDPNYKPKYVFEDGHFYCDGKRVQPSQMTEKEIRLYIPKEFWTGYFKGKLPCPLGKCETLFDPGPNLRRSWTGHFRSCHKEWYAIHGKAMQVCENYGELALFVQNTEILVLLRYVITDFWAPQLCSRRMHRCRSR